MHQRLKLYTFDNKFDYLVEHNHSLEFTTSNYSSMPNSQHV